MRSSIRGFSTFLWFIFLAACYAFLDIGKQQINNELIFFLHHLLMGTIFIISIPIPDLLLRKKIRQEDCPVVRCRRTFLLPKSWLMRCFMVVDEGERKRIFSKLSLSKSPRKQTIHYYKTFDGQYKAVDGIGVLIRLVIIAALYFVLRSALPIWDITLDNR